MRSLFRAPLALATACALLPACTGLMAGPSAQASSVAPVGKDSAWVRAKRAMTAEVFSFEVQDSINGLIYGVRHPKPGTLEADPLSCRLHVTYRVSGSAGESTVASEALYAVPKGKDGQPTAKCDGEMADALQRMASTILTGR
ncbi:MAG: hypothetical protein IPF77_15105 [Gemmatimonadetes bacterium]|nr:hypothetical protein [Gemmatimonadota bacterium]